MTYNNNILDEIHPLLTEEQYASLITTISVEALTALAGALLGHSFDPNQDEQFNAGVLKSATFAFQYAENLRENPYSSESYR